MLRCRTHECIAAGTKISVLSVFWLLVKPWEMRQICALIKLVLLSSQRASRFHIHSFMLSTVGTLTENRMTVVEAWLGDTYYAQKEFANCNASEAVKHTIAQNVGLCCGIFFIPD